MLLDVVWQVLEVCSLAPKFVRYRKLSMADVALLKRTAIDLVMLIPYSIVMIIPLTPPGHVFAFRWFAKYRAT